ncbi:MFS transporter [Clostridium sp. AWRP]|uniref:MFS transporter n=1 Tax=Clostridium sp. AWRP TaxID=2212991 RepID=UPI00158657CF|nr:MFS transporter [Clostridium sp. AWRP]
MKMQDKDAFKENLKFSEKFGYGCGDLAINFTWASLGMFVVYFYTDVVGMSAAIIGTIMLFSRCLDGVLDVIMGTIVDKTNSKYGKARPWILWGSIPFVVLTVSIFMVPNISIFGKIVYIVISYNLLMIAFTAIAIPYGTLNSLVTQDQHQREVLNLFRMFLAQIGVLIVTNLTMPLVNLFGGKQPGWALTYSVLGVVSLILFVYVFKTQKERVKPIKKEKIPLKISLKALCQNKYWFIATIFFIVYSIGYAINQGSTVYYAKYLLGNSSLVGGLTIAYLAPVLVGFLMISKVYDKYGKRNAMIIGSIISIGGYLITIINPYSLTVVMVSQIVKGFGQAFLLGGVWALFPDTIEYGEWKTGIRNEGLLYSGGSLGQKMGIGFGTAITGWILAWGGYNGAQAVQASSAVFSIKALFIHVPIIIYVAQIILLLCYGLDKEYPRIMKDLQLRKSKMSTENN